MNFENILLSLSLNALSATANCFQILKLSKPVCSEVDRDWGVDDMTFLFERENIVIFRLSYQLSNA